LQARDALQQAVYTPDVVRIVTDSTADLNEAQQQGAGITVVPLNVRFGDQVFKDHVDLSGDEFFARLKASPQLPKTSQPSVGAFEEVFRPFREAGDDVVAVLISSKVSGTFGAAEMAARAVDGEHIEIIDSLTASMALGFLALEGAKLAKSGATRQEVANRIRSLVPKARVLAAVDTLTYLERGGRIGRARALLGSLLNVKPLITLQDGEVAPLGRARGRVQAIDKLVTLLERDGKLSNLAVLHGAARADAERLRDRVSGNYPGLDIPLAETGAVISTYTGTGVIGFTYLVA
jgi:DegV family protein with EDD domain